MTSYRDALSSFVDQSRKVARLERELAELRKTESELANLKQVCRRLTTTWREVGAILGAGDEHMDVRIIYGVCATELEKVVGPDVEPDPEEAG